MIDFKKTFLLLLPIRLRSVSLLMAFLNSSGSLLNAFFMSWLSWIRDRRYEMGITPQVCYIEKMLNDEFDKEHRRIYISEPEVLVARFFYISTDDKNWSFDGDVFFADNTRFNYPYDFIINLPTDVLINKERLIALVNKYKLLGKTYILKWIE